MPAAPPVESLGSIKTTVPTPPPPKAPGETAKGKAFASLRALADKGPGAEGAQGDPADATNKPKAEADKGPKPEGKENALKVEKPDGLSDKGATEGGKEVGADKAANPTEGDKGATLPKESDGDKKPGPWQLKEKWEKRAKTLEVENVELKNKLTKIGNPDELLTRAERAEARAKELADEIRYVDYTKSDEFKEKYAQPYDRAWAKAVADVKELVVTLADGSTREATANDMLEISNMPLGKARQVANEMFGDAADDVMAHRRVIRDLAEAQSKALEEAKKTGSSRMQEKTAAQERAVKETHELFDTYTKEDASKYEFLKEKEGDEEWNSKLSSALKFTNEAFTGNPHDPKLTREERAAMVRRHAALKGRAIGFTMMKLEAQRLKAQLAERDKTIAELKGSSPSGGNGSPTGNGVIASTVDPMTRAKSKLRTMAI